MPSGESSDVTHGPWTHSQSPSTIRAWPSGLLQPPDHVRSLASGVAAVPGFVAGALAHDAGLHRTCMSSCERGRRNIGLAS